MMARAAKHGSSRGFYDGAEGLLHIFGHFDFVLAPLPVEAENGNAPLVDHAGIDLAIGILVGNHLSSAAESDVGAVGAAALLLQADAVALMLVANAIEAADARHVASAAELDVIAAQEFV